MRYSFLVAAAMLALGIATPASAQTIDSRLSNSAFGRFAAQQFDATANVLTNTLSAALSRSRNEARADSQPIPDEIRAGLAPYYSEELLDSVRFRVGDTSPDGVAGFAIRNGNAAAVTLVDTIVFKNDGHTKNLALWAHEMHHVQQFKEWGVAGFAARYAMGWQAVEAEAEARATDYVAWYKDRTGQTRTAQAQ